jgi:hypothetical protein
MKLRWDGTINAGSIMQALTVIVVFCGAVMAYSAFTTGTTIELANINKKIDANQGALLEKIGEIRAEATGRDTTQTKALADMKTDLTASQQQTAANVAQLQRTIDQTIPRFEDRFTTMVGQFADVFARLKGVEDEQDKTGNRLFVLEQFKTKVESASPAVSHKSGG